MVHMGLMNQKRRRRVGTGLLVAAAGLSLHSTAIELALNTVLIHDRCRYAAARRRRARDIYLAAETWRVRPPLPQRR